MYVVNRKKDAELSASAHSKERCGTLHYFDKDNKNEVSTKSIGVRAGKLIVAESLVRWLKSHQKEALRIVCRRLNDGKGTFVAHEMGLGKTLTGIAAMTAIFHARQNSKVILICPKGLVDAHWALELLKWCDKTNANFEFRWYIMVTFEHATWAMWQQNGGVLITGYDCFRITCNKYEFDIDYLIVDEAHNCKGAKMYEVLQKHAKSPFLLMSGSPIQNYISDLLAMMKLIEPDKTVKFPIEIITDALADNATTNDVLTMHAGLRLLNRILGESIHRCTNAQA